MANDDPSWMITETVMVRSVLDADDYGSAFRVCVRSMADAAGSYRECELRYMDGELTFNAVRVDVGGDFMAYLSLMDEAGNAEPGEWTLSAPYPDDDHDCPKQNFLDDPITRAHAVRAEMVGLISCPVCDAREAE